MNSATKFGLKMLSSEVHEIYPPLAAACPVFKAEGRPRFFLWVMTLTRRSTEAYSAAMLDVVSVEASSTIISSYGLTVWPRQLSIHCLIKRDPLKVGRMMDARGILVD
jgi:hypothetical protein